jgi:hypothetical protein
MQVDLQQIKQRMRIPMMKTETKYVVSGLCIGFFFGLAVALYLLGPYDFIHAKLVIGLGTGFRGLIGKALYEIRQSH